MDYNNATPLLCVFITCIYPLDIIDTCVKAFMTWPNKYICCNPTLGQV